MTTELERVADHIAIERLHYDYAFAADRPVAFDGDGVAVFFTTDAEWNGPTGNHLHGHQEIADHFNGLTFAPPTHHFMTNVRIDIDESGTKATSTAYLLMYSRYLKPDGTISDPVKRANRYSNSIVKVDGRWLFDRVTVIPQYGDPFQ